MKKALLTWNIVLMVLITGFLLGGCTGLNSDLLTEINKNRQAVNDLTSVVEANTANIANLKESNEEFAEDITEWADELAEELVTELAPLIAANTASIASVSANNKEFQENYKKWADDFVPIMETYIQEYVEWYISQR